MHGQHRRIQPQPLHPLELRAQLQHLVPSSPCSWRASFRTIALISTD